MNLLKDKVFKGLKWLSFLQIFRYLIELLIIIFTARLISPENFGIIAISLSIIAILDTFSETGLKTAIVQFKDDTLIYLNSAWTLQNMRSIVLYLLLLILVDPITNLLKIDYIFLVVNILALRIFFQSLTNPYLNYNVRALEYKNIVMINICGSLSRLIFIIPLAYFLQNYWALVIGAIISPFVKCVVSYLIIDYKPKIEFNKTKIIRLLNFGGWLWGSRIIYSLIKVVPNFFIGKNFGLNILGGYKQAEQLGTITEQIFKKLSANILLPIVSDLNRSSSINKDLIKNNIVFLTSFSLIIGIFGYFYSNVLVNVILGPKWEFSIPIVKLYFIIGAIAFFCNTISVFIVGVGNTRVDFFSKLFNFLILFSSIFFCESVKQVLFLLILSFGLQFLFLISWVILKFKINLFDLSVDFIIYSIPILCVVFYILIIEQNLNLHEIFTLLFSFAIFMILTYLQFKLNIKGLLKALVDYWK